MYLAAPWSKEVLKSVERLLEVELVSPSPNNPSSIAKMRPFETAD